MLIYYINNIKINSNKISLLDNETIKKLEKIYDKNINYLSGNSISKVLNIDIHDDIDNNNKIVNNNNKNIENWNQNNNKIESIQNSDEDEINNTGDDINNLNLEEK